MINMDHIPENEDIDRPLSDKEAAFVNVYLETHSLKMASEAVGVAVGTGSSWKKRPHVAAVIEEMQKDSAIRAGITNEWLIEQIKETALLAKKDASWNAALNGFRLLGEINGMFDKDKGDGVQYNIMGSVIIAPDEESARKLLDNPQNVIEGEYEVLSFNIGEDVKT